MTSVTESNTISGVEGEEKVPETVFSPIKTTPFDSEKVVFQGDNEDSCNRRMSREDIETMEIMSKDPKRTESPAYEELPLNRLNDQNSIAVESLKSEKRSSTSTPSSLVTRVTDPILKQNNIFSAISASDLIEYQWPADGSGDYYMLQEQVSTFLGITSFKRKYPEIERRKLDPQELNYLMSKMMVTDVQVTLGLTAVRSHDVCDMMIKEYPEKYQEYTQVLDEKQKQSIKNKHLQYSAPTVEKSQMPSYIKKAMKQVSSYNARLNRQRKDEYGAYYDMQTNVLHFPKRKVKKVDPELTRPSLYPCALIPGQFQDYFQKYASSELFYLPLNTAMYGPPAPVPDNLVDMDTSGSDPGSESDSADTADNKSVKSLASSTKPPATTKPAAEPTPPPKSATPEIVVEPTVVETKPEEPTKEEKEPEIEETNKEAEESLMEYDEDPEKPVCGICLKDETCNKKGDYEDLISCSQCDNHGHPSCLDMSKDLVSVIVTYNWQCLECKTCTYCTKPHHEDKMMFCDRCDRGYHTFCVGLRNLPSGLWMCPQCTRSDPDFAKRGGRRGTPRKRRASPVASTPPPSDYPPKQRRKRRTKKEMEEAREKERIEKEEKMKKRQEKKEMKIKKKRQQLEKLEKKEASAAGKDKDEKKKKEDLEESSVVADEDDSKDNQNDKEDSSKQDDSESKEGD